MNKAPYEGAVVELAAYMLTSARGLVDEPASYGPFRLLDGASRLFEILIDSGHPQSAGLKALKDKIDERKFVLMTDEAAFVALLDETVLDVTRLLAKQG